MSEIKLSKLLQLQLLYCVLGILFNIVSWIIIQSGSVGLTPTVPIEGIIAMSLYGLFLLTGYFRKIGGYRILMVLSLLIFGYGGIVKHFFTYNETPELYYSLFSGILGASINVFGFILNLIAALGKFIFDK